jgi:hypothetical protein
MIKQKEKITQAKFENEMEDIKMKLRVLLNNKIFDPIKVMNFLLFDQNKVSYKDKIKQKTTS